MQDWELERLERMNEAFQPLIDELEKRPPGFCCEDRYFTWNDPNVKFPKHTGASFKYSKYKKYGVDYNDIPSCWKKFEEYLPEDKNIEDYRKK